MSGEQEPEIRRRALHQEEEEGEDEVQEKDPLVKEEGEGGEEEDWGLPDDNEYTWTQEDQSEEVVLAKKLVV